MYFLIANKKLQKRLETSIYYKLADIRNIQSLPRKKCEMRNHLKAKSLAALVAATTEIEELKHALVDGAISILCDGSSKVFWFEKCPDHLFDVAVSEIKRTTGFTPIDEA